MLLHGGEMQIEGLFSSLYILFGFSVEGLYLLLSATKNQLLSFVVRLCGGIKAVVAYTVVDYADI